jgi:hypothetical protein
MAELVVLHWRDIPSQVITRAGRKTAKRPLSRRFQEAIDHAAMRAGLYGSDAYLAEWRRADPVICGDDLEAEASAAEAHLERAYDDARLAALVAQGGKESS